MKLKQYLKNIIDKFKIFNNSSGYLVLLVIFTGLVAGAGFKVFPIGSQGVDPATPLNNDTVAQINQAKLNGADSFKLLIYDNDPALLSSAINAAYSGDIKITLYVRNAGDFNGETFANIINTGISDSNYATSLGNNFYVSLYNEPEVDEPKTEKYVAENWIDFYRNLSNTGINISPYIPNVNYTGNADGNWYQYFNNLMLKIAELGGAEAINRINFMGINAHGDVANDINSALAIFSLYLNNPQILLAETSPLGGTKESFESGLKRCQASGNCIGAFFFNAFLANGMFNKDWDAYEQNQSTIYNLLNQYSLSKGYNPQNFKEDFLLFSRYLFDPSSLSESELERAIAFYNLLSSTFAKVAASYANNNGMEEIFGVSSGVTINSCLNNQFAFNLVTNRRAINNQPVDVSHPKYKVDYILRKENGEVVGSGHLGGQDQAGANQNRPYNPNVLPGALEEILNYKPGDIQTLNQSVSLAPLASAKGTLEIIIATDVDSNVNNGRLQITNTCTIAIDEGGICVGEPSCTGGGPSMYCAAVNDSVRSPAPLEPKPDMTPIMACNGNSASGENNLTLSYTNNFANVGTKNFRLGFEIVNMQLAYPLADDRGPNYMLEAVEFEDNTPPRIVRNLATKATKTNKDPAYIKASLGNIKVNANGSEIKGVASSADTGIDYLEFVFENLCYISNSQSGKATSCEKIFRDFEAELSENAYDYNIPDYYINLKNDEILSCNQSYNNVEYRGKWSENYNARGYGSYLISDFPVTVSPLYPGASKGLLSVDVEANVSLAMSRVNWMITSLFSLENNFISSYFASPEMFKSYYDNCLVKYINNYGGAAKINYRFVLEEKQELQCENWQIKLDEYQWKRVASSRKLGSSYVPGLGALYLFLSHLPEEALGTKSTAGLTFRFDPNNPDSCQLQ